MTTRIWCKACGGELPIYPGKPIEPCKRCRILAVTTTQPQPQVAVRVRASTTDPPLALTMNDLRFLKSLRIKAD